MVGSIYTLFFTIFFFISISGPKPWASATTITFSNKCPYPVWPGIQPTAGKPILARGGFLLPSHQIQTIELPPLWGGRFWGRHGCTFDAAGHGQCAIGDCGGSLYCEGRGGAPPTTLAEISLPAGQDDYYDVSFVDGYNLPMVITPIVEGRKCEIAGCQKDLNKICPASLQVRSGNGSGVVACKSACTAFNLPEYCCTGSHGSANTCGPSAYSRIFKRACPKAYSYAYDDPTSLFTCSKANYLVTFCPN